MSCPIISCLSRGFCTILPHLYPYILYLVRWVLLFLPKNAAPSSRTIHALAVKEQALPKERRRTLVAILEVEEGIYVGLLVFLKTSHSNLKIFSQAGLLKGE